MSERRTGGRAVFKPVGNTTNAYHCPDCGGYIVTEDLHSGVTPMCLACRVQGEPGPDNTCHGTMHSMMYPDKPWPAEDGFGRPIPTEPTWEWYAPGSIELKRMAKKARQRGGDYEAALDHVLRGGLQLRRR